MAKVATTTKMADTETIVAGSAAPTPKSRAAVRLPSSTKTGYVDLLGRVSAHRMGTEMVI